MKTLEELDISPVPWHIEKNTGVLCAKSERYKHPIVDDCGNFENNNDKRLIAAAPELYESLRECLDILDRLEKYYRVKYYREVDAATYKTMAKARAAIEKSGGLK